MPPEAFPRPSAHCGADFAALGPPGRHACSSDPPQADPSYFYEHPGRPPLKHTGAPLVRPAGLSDGYGYGMMLLPYVLDWGDCLGRILRKKAYPTIFHSFPRAVDRQWALYYLDGFAWPSDQFYPPLTIYLLNAPPFGGFTWDAELLCKWLEFANNTAAGLGAQRSLGAELAAVAATTWCSNVRGCWETLTRERFPYDTASMVDYWRATDDGTTLPSA